jgi:hypothetical protein
MSTIRICRLAFANSMSGSQKIQDNHFVKPQISMVGCHRFTGRQPISSPSNVLDLDKIVVTEGKQSEAPMPSQKCADGCHSAIIFLVVSDNVRYVAAIGKIPLRALTCTSFPHREIALSGASVPVVPPRVAATNSVMAMSNEITLEVQRRCPASGRASRRIMRKGGSVSRLGRLRES